jgi:hypothetical protein
MSAIDNKEMVLNISGLGIIFYSPRFVSHISEGSNYLQSIYTTERDVQSHIQKGTLVAFCTSSPGRFFLKFHSGYPDEEYIQTCAFKLRLGLHCDGGCVCFRDLYDLMRWQAACPPNQSIELEDGYYHVTLCSDVPKSGIIGHNQAIHIYLQKLDEFPKLAKQGIPELCF